MFAPEEFRERAASLRQASGEYLNPESVLAAVLERFERYVTLSRDRGAACLRAE